MAKHKTKRLITVDPEVLRDAAAKDWEEAVANGEFHLLNSLMEHLHEYDAESSVPVKSIKEWLGVKIG
jgi:hypothetical protein